MNLRPLTQQLLESKLTNSKEEFEAMVKRYDPLFFQNLHSESLNNRLGRLAIEVFIANDPGVDATALRAAIWWHRSTGSDFWRHR